MKALVFAAGLGSRLSPLTDDRPKALVQVCGKPILEHVLTGLIQQGVEEAVINVHHFADKIEAFLEEKQNFNIKIQISDERSRLLETGGGLLKARKFLEDSENFILHNSDVISNINIRKAYKQHEKSKALASLIVQDRKSSRKFLFDKKNRLSGWTDLRTGEQKISRKNTEQHQLAFTGIHILSSRIFDFITARGKFSITPEYLSLAREHQITGIRADHSWWFDIGTPERLRKAEQFLCK